LLRAGLFDILNEIPFDDRNLGHTAGGWYGDVGLLRLASYPTIANGGSSRAGEECGAEREAV
jgi:hypothetical protein